MSKKSKFPLTKGDKVRLREVITMLEEAIDYDNSTSQVICLINCNKKIQQVLHWTVFRNLF